MTTMKNTKNLTFFMITFLMMIFAAVSAYADDDIFEITGGLDMEKSNETTFDDSREIFGTAKKGTEIIITTYTKNDNDEYEEMECTEIDVGSSGYFSGNINLEMGMNYIKIEAINGEEYQEEEVKIKRKDISIMQALKENIALPGKR